MLSAFAKKARLRSVAEIAEVVVSIDKVPPFMFCLVFIYIYSVLRSKVKTVSRGIYHDHSHCTRYGGDMSELSITASIVQGSAIGPVSYVRG